MSHPNSSAPSDALPPRLEADLARVREWLDGAGLQLRRQLADIDVEEERLNTSIEDLRRQILSLGALRSQIASRAAGLDTQALRRAWGALTAGLDEDRALIEGRAVMLQKAQDDERSRAEKALGDPEVASMFAEYERYRDLEGTLASLPPSYRDAIRQHHEELQVKLAPLLQQVRAQSASLELPRMRFSVVLAVERSEEDRPELLQVIAPVDADLYVDWINRQEDLSTWIAYRVVEFAARLAKSVGVPDAPITYTELAGHLALRVALGDVSAGTDLRPVAQRLLEEIGGGASELKASGLVPWPIWIEPQVLDIADLPPSDRESWGLAAGDDPDDSWQGDPPEAWDDALDPGAALAPLDEPLAALDLPHPDIPPEPISLEPLDDAPSFDDSMEH